MNKSLMQEALGDAWEQLPPGLQAHYAEGTTTDIGHMDVEFPAFMRPCLWALSKMGALVQHKGRHVPTTVVKTVVGKRQVWRRTLQFPNGPVAQFNSFWVLHGDNQLIEYVNPWLGLQMAVEVRGGRLLYHGVRFVVRLGRWLLPTPEWLALGHTTIEERGTGANRFVMDFRLTHPLLGQVFRYSGEFESVAG